MASKVLTDEKAGLGGRVERDKESQQQGTHPAEWSENFTEVKDPGFSPPGLSSPVATYSGLRMPSAEAQGFLPCYKELAGKKAVFGDRVGWYKEVPVAGMLPAGSLEPSSLRAVLRDPRTLQMNRQA